MGLMKVYKSLHCTRVSNKASICGLRRGCGSGQNLRTDVDEIFGDPHLSGLWSWVVHTTAVGQRRRNYDVTISRHRTLRSHAFTGGSRHALTTPQYLDKTDNADRRRYSCDVIKTLLATEATCRATSKAIAAAIIRGQARVGRLHATRHSWHLTKLTETLLMYFDNDG